jgi:hypothetical protein
MTVAQRKAVTVDLPAELDAPSAKLVYCYLTTAGASTVDDLCRALDLGKLTLFPLLRSLRSDGHIEKADGRYVAA